MEADHLSKDEMKAMQKQVMPLYAIQFFLGLFTTIAFANLIPYITTFSIYHIAFWIWIGFIVPLQIAAVIWGKTQKRFWTKQIFVMISYQLVAIMLTAWILMF